MALVHHRRCGSLWAALAVLVGLLGGVLPLSAVLAQTGTPTHVQTINTGAGSSWGPTYSPDPSGITYWARLGHLVIVDGEVEEMALWAGANVFQSTLTGSLVRTYDISSWNNEPVGIDIEIAENGRWFISNDSKKTIFEINLGADGEFGTSDDKRRAFLTSAFGNNDPEGLTLGGGKLYTVDGGGARVYITQDGGNGIYEGSDPTTWFDVAGIGIHDPEGIDYDPRTGHLWIVDRSRKRLNEVTTTGNLLQSIDLRTLVGAVNPGDVTLAPSSTGSGELNLYIADRGVDNNVDPNENDGKIYEIAIGPPPPDTTPPQVIARSPLQGATGVSRASNVTATFDESVTGVNATSFTLTSASGSVAATVTYDDGTRTATLNPDVDLAPDTLYTAQLTSGITDLAGNALSPVSWSFTTGSTALSNLLANPGFELDANNDNKPDAWSTNKKFTRSNEIVPHGESYVGKFFATNDSGATINQHITNLTATTYQFKAWVNIPPTNDAFTFRLRVRWRDVSGSTLRTDTIQTYSTHTNGTWQEIAANLTAPVGTTSGLIIMDASSLNLAIYVDDFLFSP